MPRLIAVRVVSFPATARRMKNAAISWGASMSSPRVLLTNAEVRSFLGLLRRSSASSFMSVTSRTAAPIDRGASVLLAVWRLGVPRAKNDVGRMEDRVNSLRGMPIMSQMTRSGNGWEIASTRSTSPFSHMLSMTSAQTASTESRTACNSRVRRRSDRRCRAGVRDGDCPWR